MYTKIKSWFLVFLWAGFIFFLSSQPDLKSGLPNEWDFFLRKLAHITEYAILTFLLIRALSEYQLSERKILVFSVSLAVFYAFSDEYHQYFILGRVGAVSDVLIDCFGILSVAWLKKIKVVK